MSDVHNAWSITLKVHNQQRGTYVEEQSINVPSKARKWQDDKKDVFCTLMGENVQHIYILCDEIRNTNINNVTPGFIDHIVEDICTLFDNAAKQSFGVLEKKNNKTIFKKPWFTKECKIARYNYRKAKRLYKRYGSVIFKGVLIINNARVSVQQKNLNINVFLWSK